MIYRKTWFDYVLWAVYAGLCVTLLAFMGYHIYVSYVAMSLARLGAFVIFPVLVCVYLALRLSSQAVRKRHGFSLHGKAMLEAFVVSAAFVFGVLYRISGVLHTAAVRTPGEFYERALVRAGEGTEPMAHGVSDLYVRCLTVVFSFLGNGAASAILFQIFLQMLALLVGFFVVRKAAGRLAACVTLLFLSFSGVFAGESTVVDPACLYLFLYLCGLFLMVSFLKASLADRPGLGGFPGALFVGAVLGVLTWLELWSVTLLLFLAGLFTGKKQGEGGRKKQAASFLVTVLSCAAGFFAAAAVDAAVSGAGFRSRLSVWASPYLHMEGRGADLGFLAGHYVYWALLLLAASFLVFEFLRGGREQDFSLWILVCVLVTPPLMTNFSVVGYGNVALFLWSVMAGLGVKNCVLGGQAEAVQAKTEKADVPAAVPEEKPRFIENPLPLPKKHVKREMDYDYEVAEVDMRYEVEVSEEDDFDR